MYLYFYCLSVAFLVSVILLTTCRAGAQFLSSKLKKRIYIFSTFGVFVSQHGEILIVKGCLSQDSILKL